MLIQSKVRRLVKGILVGVLGSQMATSLRLASLRKAGVVTILNLHRVSGCDVSAYDALHPKLFDALLVWLKPRFHVLTFRELAQFQATDKSPLILSFDDGYLDFFEVAMPILEKHRLRANQNVIPGCIDSGRPPLNVLLQDFIGQAPHKLLQEWVLPGGVRFSDTSDRKSIGRRASAVVKKLPFEKQRAFIVSCQSYFDRMDNFLTTPMMNLEQVAESARLHEIGVHSWDHASMSSESDEYLEADASRCQAWLAEHFSPAQMIYAFPNGMAREGQPESVRKAGFDHVLCVDEQFSRPSNWKHKRFTFHAQNEIESRFRAIGGTARPRRQ
jgi:peptidoglycan/xylan/chitin deacetylase (PgdA/CDA1 family)